MIKQINLEKSHLLEKIHYSSRIIKEKDDAISILRKELNQKDNHLKRTINELNKVTSLNKKLSEKEVKRNSNSNLKQNENEEIMYSNSIVLDYYSNNNRDKNLISNVMKIKNSYISKGKHKLSIEEENKKYKTVSNRNTPTRVKKRISNKIGIFNNCQSKKVKNCNAKNSIQSSSNAIKNFLFLKNFNIEHCFSFTLSASTSLIRRLAIFKRESQKTLMYKNESGYGLDYFLNNITDNENNFSDE